MTPEQQIRATALGAATAMIGPQLAQVVHDEDFDWTGTRDQFNTLVETYADYIQHGHWPVPDDGEAT